MNTKDRNTKDKKKVEYEDIFENGDKAKDTENAENETKNFETKTLGKLTDHLAKHRSK